MKKLIASALIFAVAVVLAPINVIAAARYQAGSIAGVATVDGKPLGNVTVRLRNVDSGQLVGTQTANARGEFSFTGLPAGNFVVETVAANGTLLGTSARIALTAGAMVATGVGVATSGAAAAAAGAGGAAGAGAAGAGAAGAGAAGAGGALAAVGGTVGAVAIAGGAIAATSVIIANKDSSTSQ